MKAIRSSRVLTPDGIRAAVVYIERGRIVRVAPSTGADRDAGPADVEWIDAGDRVVMPGLVDTHVHVNEPGRTEWEGFATATRAAAAGGVTTLLDMPLNSIPATTDAAALEVKRDAARGQTWVDVGFIGGVIPGNASALRGLADAGVRAFKCFLVPSGVDEFPNVVAADLRDAMPVIASLGLPLMVHAELPDAIEICRGDASRYQTYLASRPPAAETRAVALMADLCGATGARTHIVHVSAAETIPTLRQARDGGLPLTAETCPHYLALDDSLCADGATEFKCAPPIRDRSCRDALWRALADDDLDMIVSDHSPSPPSLKRGTFFEAWGGVASLQLSASVVWTEMRARGIGIEHLQRWMAEAPARLAGLGDRKGRIAPGYDADVVIWSADDEFVVEPRKLLHRHPITPYVGRRLVGVVERTYVRGELAYDRETGPVATPPGRLI